MTNIAERDALVTDFNAAESVEELHALWFAWTDCDADEHRPAAGLRSDLRAFIREFCDRQGIAPPDFKEQA